MKWSVIWIGFLFRIFIIIWTLWNVHNVFGLARFLSYHTTIMQWEPSNNIESSLPNNLMYTITIVMPKFLCQVLNFKVFLRTTSNCQVLTSAISMNTWADCAKWTLNGVRQRWWIIRIYLMTCKWSELIIYICVCVCYILTNFGSNIRIWIVTFIWDGIELNSYLTCENLFNPVLSVSVH